MTEEHRHQHALTLSDPSCLIRQGVVVAVVLRAALETKRGQVVTLITSVTTIAMGATPPAQLAGPDVCPSVPREGACTHLS